MAAPTICLVTGGAGFIGSHLAEALLAAGNRVRVLDDLSTGRRENLPHRAGLDLVEGSVTSAATLDAVMRDVDCVFHLAAIASVARSVADPEGTGKVNLGGTVAVLEAAHRAGVRRVVFASSAAIYGDAGEGPIGEDRAANPLSPYGRQKWESERVCAAFARDGLATLALRFFNVYGSRQRPDSDYSGVVSIFIEHALAGRAPAIFGDGAHTPDIVHVSDVVAALAAAARAPGALAGPLNIGTGRPTSVNRIWSELQRILGLALEARHAAPRPGDVRHSLSDPRRAAERLGWRAMVAFPDGLARLVAEGRPGGAAARLSPGG
jgi:UDP-glucose 4-epimerase